MVALRDRGGGPLALAVLRVAGRRAGFVGAASLPPMTEFEELRDRYRSAAAQDLPPLTRELVALCDAEGDDARVRAIAVVVGQAFMAGVKRGNAETMAQLAEQGVPFKANVLTSEGS